MGCDGGTIPRRDELVRTKQKGEQKDAKSENAFKWKHCAISQQALKKPIVACDLGRLYNKEAVIQYLLTKTEAPVEIASHIRQLKDVTELKLTDNPAYRDVESKGAECVDHAVSPYVCPTSLLEMNGAYKFMFNRRCGCVLSERALKNVKTEKCLKCGGGFDTNDLITLNPSDDERALLELRMAERKAAMKAAKKKVKKEVKNEFEPEPKKAKTQKIKTDSAKTEPGTSGTSLGASKLLIPEKAKESYSIAQDPNASEALKSLFTTHESAKNKPKAHWVTHNPLFY
ncbi:replication termination factor 2 [Galendromus occidentalis]|uniref:Replication termination factor 2 n=1 Tax=Galendromus occidentalis TaxID=34638 RepID=A0AAJ6QWM0_9ACAR|nr:replication termination factor 2 [Galendromus occidentalis]